MKNWLVLIALLCSAQVFAAPDSELLRKTFEAQPFCEGFVRFDDQNLYLGAGAIRVVSITTGQAFNLNTAHGAVDVLTDGSTAYILTAAAIEEWDLTTRQRVGTYPTLMNPSEPLAYMQSARAFARYGNMLIIAHGRLGLSFFDLTAKKVIRQVPLITGQAPKESMATGVAIQGQTAYVVMDNFTLGAGPDGKPAFRGIITVDMPSQNVTGQMDGMDPGVTSVNVDDHVLIANFSGNPIWTYNLNSLKGSQLPEPVARTFKFPVRGSPTGMAAMDQKYFYTCFAKAPPTPQGQYTYVPMALDRSTLK